MSAILLNTGEAGESILQGGNICRDGEGRSEGKVELRDPRRVLVCRWGEMRETNVPEKPRLEDLMNPDRQSRRRVGGAG